MVHLGQSPYQGLGRSLAGGNYVQPASTEIETPESRERRAARRSVASSLSPDVALSETVSQRLEARLDELHHRRIPAAGFDETAGSSGDKPVRNLLTKLKEWNGKDS